MQCRANGAASPKPAAATAAAAAVAAATADDACVADVAGLCVAHSPTMVCVFPDPVAP